MREIKFRVWDHLEKEMLFPETVTPSIVDLQGGSLMQFTGLIDKNGKEIYQGDVIEANDVYGKYIGVIEWWNDRWVLEYEGHQDKSKQYQSLMTVKGAVIGNIYENPDLLTS